MRTRVAESNNKSEIASFVVLASVSGLLDAGVVVAASRCGVTGILGVDGTLDAAGARRALYHVAQFAHSSFAIRFDPESAVTPELIHDLPSECRCVVLTSGDNKHLRDLAVDVRQQQRHLLFEVVSAEQAAFAVECGADGLIAKGHESGGAVGEETSFVLLQRILDQVSVPVWVQGGIGMHSAAACYVAGAAGVVLDNQLLLMPESSLPWKAREALGRMEADETICVGRELGVQFRLHRRIGSKVITELQQLEHALLVLPREQAQSRWKAELFQKIGWSTGDKSIWPLGQDAAFAAPFARRYHNIAGIVKGIQESVRQHVDFAVKFAPLQADSNFAKAHGAKYPIFQGPMTRVSDVAAFGAAVADNGALPFLALAVLRGPQVRKLLTETRALMGGKPWGVGILGFISLELRAEQLAVVRDLNPPFCIIAGGRPDQATALEREGITTYLHVPAPALLRIFLQDGARRFIFEGRECGGHVGPRTSFVLWQEMIDVLLAAIAEGTPADQLSVVFAGGIHDARSAAMVAAMASPLVEKGVRLGVMMGTAYLFTEEAVASGAIVEGFQREAINCKSTALLESGTGHVTRCAPTKFVETFSQLKVGMTAQGKPAGEIRDALEDLNIGRLRIASKGFSRAPGNTADYVNLSLEEQLSQGLYMIGQVAAIRDKTCTMQDLHEEISTGSSAFLSTIKPFLHTPAEVPDGWAEKPCDVAIVGMSCILPGADDIGAFWTNLLNKADAITEIPKERFDANAYYDQNPKAKDKIVSHWGGFLADVPFDPIRFGIPPNTLASIDPMQLLTLVAVDAALKDAAYDTRDFPRERTSVVLGLSGGLGDLGIQYAVRSSLPMHLADLPQELMDRLPEWTEDSFAGILPNVTAGRVANRFNFGGVNFSVDAACASSLAAVYVAARELVAGSSDMVVVGGVDTVQSPFGFLCFSKSQALSPNGRCNTFDESADGIAISEGLTVLVLKRLADAEREGDRIYAVLKGVAGSSDGRGKSMTAPRQEGQVLAMQRAYRQANFRPSTVSLIEAHGTGTVAGDTTEIASLSSLFIEDGAMAQSCAIGSVKSQIGHTKSAAGATGLMKAALALYHRVLPPTLHVEKPNKALQEPHSPFFPNVDAQLWLRPAPSVPRRAGISSFGFGGTNFHAVLEEYLGDFRDPLSRPASREWPAELFLWRGKSKEAILSSIALLESALLQSSRKSLCDLAAAVCAKADLAGFSLAIVARSFDELAARLALAKTVVRQGGSQPGIFFAEPANPPKIAFLFPGQGSQYPGMLRDAALYFPEFLEQLELADRVLADRFPQRLSSYIYPPPVFTEQERQKQSQAMTDTVVAQPALGVVEIALHWWLVRLGIRPDMTAGHSYGEYVALCAAGSISNEALFKLSEARGQAIKQSVGENAGVMAAVSGNGRDVQHALNGSAEVSIANFNSPRQTIISGSSAKVKSAMGMLAGKGFVAKLIPVACAFHSPMMQPACDSLAASLAEHNFAEPTTAVYSNTLGARYPDDAEEIAKLLGSHLTKPVQFEAEIEALYQDGARLFIEVGPKGVLSNLTRQILEGRDAVILQTDLAGSNGVAQVLLVLAQLAVCGVPLNTEELFRGRVVERIDLDRIEAPVAKPGWLVDGSRAFQRTAPPVWRPPIRLSSPPDPIPISPSPQMSMTAAVSTAALPAPIELAPSADAVMLQFQNMMAQFLQTQSNVMTAFLVGVPAQQATGGTPAQYAPPVLPLPVTLSPAPIVVLPETVITLPIALPPIPSPAPIRGLDISGKLLQIVADKTGYPTDMLELDASIEADLGIDSIKRIEILHTAQHLFPSSRQHAVEAAMEKLTRARTLRELMQLLSSVDSSGTVVASAAAIALPIGAAATTAPVERVDVSAQLLRIVADKTGYPADMLDLDAGIEADLGIDSIKRIEILNAIQRLFRSSAQPAIEASMDKLTRVRTLRELGQLISVLELEQVTAAPTAAIALPVAPSFQPPAINQADISAHLLRIVADKTGYPTDMLDSDAGIEADLGIDSIKRIEILNASQRLFPASVQPAIEAGMDQLTRARTLRVMAEVLFVAATATAKQPSTSGGAKPSDALPRFELAVVDKPRSVEQSPAYQGRVCLITDDETGLAVALAEEWTRSGQQVLLLRHSPGMPITTESSFSLDLTDAQAIQDTVDSIRAKYGAIGAIVHLLPLRASRLLMPLRLTEWREQIQQDIRCLYLLARSTEQDLKRTGRNKGALLAAVTRRGGDFGLQPSASVSPIDHGLADFVKTLSLEFPEVICRVIDVDGNDSPPLLSRKLNEELSSQENTLQIGLLGNRRVTVVPRIAQLTAHRAEKIGRDWVCLLTGGARGITAQIAKKLAEGYQPTLILAGASKLDAEVEPAEITGITNPAQLRTALTSHLRASSDGKPAARVRPADVEASFQRIIRQREMQSTIASLRKFGSRVEYHSVDVRQEDAFGALIEQIYREYSRIDLVIHGAGVIEDKLIRDKQPNSFDRVVHTKGDSAFILSRYLRPEGLKCLILMSSITAAFGNRGQTDYAAANGIMNGLSVKLAAEWPGRVVALNWGPWDQAGMVSEEVRQQFLTLGVQLIDPEAGAEAVLREIESADRDCPLPVFGDGPWSKMALPAVTSEYAGVHGP